EEWRDAHAAIAEAEYRLDPQRIASLVAALHGHAQAQAKGRGRKPSGDLRHPVPRDYVESTTAAQRALYEASRDRALATVRAIENGDVVDVRYSLTPQNHTTSSYEAEGRLVHNRNAETDAALDELFSRPRLILRGEEEEAERRQTESRRFFAEEMAKIENMDDAQVTEYLRECGVTPEQPVLYRGKTPETMEEYTAGLRYREKGKKIAAKAAKDQAIKARTAARRAAEEADPVSAATSKAAKASEKANDRQKNRRANETPEQTAVRRANDAAAKKAKRAAAKV
ncbi:MAG: hypothetical protein ACRED4_09105, partial [Brevundimonas sp.]